MKFGLLGKKQRISQIVQFLDGFGKKLVVFKNVIVEKKLIHFQCCYEIIKIEFDEEFKFEQCITHLDELIVEFEKQFEEFELMHPQINLFDNPMAVNNINNINHNVNSSTYTEIQLNHLKLSFYLFIPNQCEFVELTGKFSTYLILFVIHWKNEVLLPNIHIFFYF